MTNCTDSSAPVPPAPGGSLDPPFRQSFQDLAKSHASPTRAEDASVTQALAKAARTCCNFARMPPGPFPVPNEPGPIEASRSAAKPRFHPVRGFPVPNEPGPIEARRRFAGGGLPGGRRFPVPNEPGPIEAEDIAAHATGLHPRASRFQMNRAPLKPRVLTVEPAPMFSTSRFQMNRAPLKPPPCRSRLGQVAPTGFPVPNEPGPIEANRWSAAPAFRCPAPSRFQMNRAPLKHQLVAEVGLMVRSPDVFPVPNEPGPIEAVRRRPPLGRGGPGCLPGSK